MSASEAMSVRPGAELIDGRYRLERLIGIGGMASVWEGIDQRLDRSVAVKVLSDALAADPGFCERFRREARIAAGLSHPNLVKVFDFEPKGRPCLVMEYVEGGTLDETANRPETDVETEALAVQLLGALEHIHAAGIVHRDVKPSNVLIGKDGRAMLTDFGIAQHEDATKLTQTGQVIGTLRYMAPEVHEGDRATPRSDLYSAGVVLRDYIDDDSPSGLVRLVERLSERDPALRPESATEALAYLTGAVPTVVAAAQHPAVKTREVPPADPLQTEEAPLRAQPEPEPERLLEARPTPHREYPIRGRHVVGLLAVVAAIVAVVAIVGGGEEPERGNGQESAAATEEAGAPSEELIPPPSSNADPARGAELEQQAFATLQGGDPEKAVKQYEKALAEFPDDARTPDAFATYPNYAYALYSYGDALLQAGRADEAVAVLEERLRFSDQQDTVQAKLDEARAAAAG